MIDVGSNSVLLLVSELQDGVWNPIRETSEVTALGEGTKATGLLSETGMADTLAAVKRAYEVAHSMGAESVRAAATMAARIASNTQDFLARAEAAGTPIMVLPGEEEAELGFRAVVDDPTLIAPSEYRVSIIDVGGHSTELVTAERNRSNGWNVLFRQSFPVGTLGLRGSVLEGQSPDGLALMRATSQIDELIASGNPPSEAGVAVVLGATGTNLVTIREGMAEWDSHRVHGAWLDYEEVSKAVGWMSPMTDAQRRAILGIEPGRERTIHIGSLILERFLHALHAEGCRVSVRGWRYALLERC